MQLSSYTKHLSAVLGVGRMGSFPPWISNCQQKKVVFLVLSGKIKFRHFCLHWKNSLVAPLWKKYFRRPWAQSIRSNHLSTVIRSI